MTASCRVALAAFLVAATAGGQPCRAENMAVTLADVTLGARVSGPAVDMGVLAGRVVVLEFWGIHCPPCIASMPHLEEIHRRLGPRGLVVIGAHAQRGGAEEIRQTVDRLGVTFTIVEQATVKDGMDFGGIPHCMVFDHTGRCSFRGHPSAAQDAIAAAVEAAPAAVLAGREFVALAELAETARDEHHWAGVLKKAGSLVDAEDPETAAEARFVVERIERRGREMLDEARGLAQADPPAALALAQRCGTVFKGSDVAAEVGKLQQEWRKDRHFQAAVKAGQQLSKLEALQAAAARAAGAAPSAAVRRQARDLAESIAKGWPGSAAAAKAAAIAATLVGTPPAAP